MHLYYVKQNLMQNQSCNIKSKRYFQKWKTIYKPTVHFIRMGLNILSADTQYQMFYDSITFMQFKIMLLKPQIVLMLLILIHFNILSHVKCFLNSKVFNVIASNQLEQFLTKVYSHYSVKPWNLYLSSIAILITSVINLHLREERQSFKIPLTFVS